MSTKKFFASFFIALLTLVFTACGFEAKNSEQEVPSKESSLDSSDPAEENEEVPDVDSTKEDHPYLSITYGRDNPDNVSGREMVFYSYDINSKQLKEEAILPFESSYASGVVSKYDNVVYYQSSIEPGNYDSGNCLWVYDISTGETRILNDENHHYNDILLMDEDTLVLMMRTDAHPIMPVILDLNSNSFTYIADVNNEPFIYTSGATIPVYNYKTGQFSYIYWNEDEERGDYSSFETSIDHYVAIVSKDLVKDTNKIFTHNAKIDEMNMYSVAQISENELLITMINWAGAMEFPLYYSLVFNDGEASFTPAECPYPNANYVYNLCTVDEGKTFFFYLSKDSIGSRGGVYSYDTETEVLTPILLNDSETNGHYINFSIIGPGCETYTSQENNQNSETEAQQSGSVPVNEENKADESAPETSEEQQTSSAAEIPIAHKKFATFEEITEAGYYPTYMQPYTVVIYDEEGKPTIVEGGEILKEEAESRDDISEIGYYVTSKDYAIVPNTKVEYDLHGFLQNIYYLRPGTESEYQLAPPGY